MRQAWAAAGCSTAPASSIELGEIGNAEADLQAAAQLAGQHGNVYLQRAASYNLAAMYATDLRARACARGAARGLAHVGASAGSKTRR